MKTGAMGYKRCLAEEEWEGTCEEGFRKTVGWGGMVARRHT
jgi:hypothetical protein